MLLAFGIVLIVTGAAVDSLSQNPVLCRFAEDKTCYAAVGQRLELTIPQGINFVLRKSESSNEQLILLYKRKMLIVNPSGWSFVTDNNTVIISGAKKNDSGTYRLEITQEDWKYSTVSLQLNVEEPTTPTTTSTKTTAVNTQTQSINGTGLTVNITETYNHSLTHTSNPDSKTFPPFLRFNVFVAVWLFEVIILLSLLVGAFYIYTRIYKKQRAAERENQ